MDLAVCYMLLQRSIMQFRTRKLGMILLLAIDTRQHLKLINSDFILIPKKAKMIIIHLSLPQYIQQILIFQVVYYRILQRFDLINRTLQCYKL